MDGLLGGRANRPPVNPMEVEKKWQKQPQLRRVQRPPPAMQH